MKLAGGVEGVVVIAPGNVFFGSEGCFGESGVVGRSGHAAEMEAGDGGGIGRSEDGPDIKRAADVVEKGFDDEGWGYWGIRPFYSVSGEGFRNELGGTAAARAAFALEAGSVDGKSEATAFIGTLAELEGGVGI
jgi:hypothetical protein